MLNVSIMHYLYEGWCSNKYRQECRIIGLSIICLNTSSYNELFHSLADVDIEAIRKLPLQQAPSAAKSFL